MITFRELKWALDARQQSDLNCLSSLIYQLECLEWTIAHCHNFKRKKPERQIFEFADRE